MSKGQLKSVPNCADLVEEYRRKYPQTERKALNKLILSMHPKLCQRTLDRHLKKAFFQKKPSEKQPFMLKKDLQLSAENTNRLWREIDAIEAEYRRGNFSKAYEIAKLARQTCPSPLKQTILDPSFQTAEESLKQIRKINPDLFFRGIKEIDYKKKALPILLEKLSEAAHQN